MRRRRGEHPERDPALGTLLTAPAYLSQLGSFAFPDVEGSESEFPEKVPRVAGVWPNGRFFGAAMLALPAVGYAAGRGGAGLRGCSVTGSDRPANPGGRNGRPKRPGVRRPIGG